MQGRKVLLTFVLLMSTGTAWADPPLPPPPDISTPGNPILIRKGVAAPTPLIFGSDRQKPAPLKPIPLVAQRPTTKVKNYASSGSSTSLPIVSVDVAGPTEINIGKTITFAITVKNLGESIAHGVVVETFVPENARVLSTTPKAAEQSGGAIRFEIGDLQKKSKKQLNIEIVPQSTGQINLAADVHFATNTGISVLVREPKLTIAMTGPQSVVYGNTITRKIIVSNSGDGTAGNVRVTPTMPKGLVDVKIDPPDGRIGSLVPGESAELKITAVVRTTGSLTAECTARADDGLEASVREQIKVLRPMIEVETAGPALNYLNRDGIYAILVSNPGDADAKNIEVTSVIPTGLRVAAVERPARSNKEKSTLIWTIPKLAAGASEVIRLKIEAVGEGEQIQKIVARADDGLVAETEHRTEVISRADLSMTVADTAGPVKVGDAAKFEITVTNRGTKDAKKVDVKVVLPEAMDAIQSDNYNASGSEVIFPTISVAAGERQVLKFEAVGSGAGDQIVRVVMRSEHLSREIVKEESIFFYDSQRPRLSSRP